MTLPIDVVMRQKLVLAKQLYQHAEAQSFAKYSVVSRTMAVIGFDLAAETLIKAVVSALDTKEQPEKVFDALIQQANDKLNKAGHGSLPDEGSVRHVHEIRNFVQHKAVYPDETQVGECRTYIRDFVRKTLAQLWGLNFETISLVDFVKDVEVKSRLAKAQSALEQGDYSEAILNANAGLALTIYKARRKLFPSSLPRLSEPQARIEHRIPGSAFAPRGTHEETWRVLKAEIDGISKKIDAMQETVRKLREDIRQELSESDEVTLYNILALNYADFLRLRSIAGTARVTRYMGSEEPEVGIFNMKENPSLEDAGFVLTYCVESAIQIESRLGNLDNELGVTKFG